MSQVIGPIDKSDWITLLQLKKSIDFSRNQPDRMKFKTVLRKEKAIYNCVLKPYLKQEAV